MEEGVTIAKVPDWMVLKPEMMAHLIREHEKLAHPDRRRDSHVATRFGIRNRAEVMGNSKSAPGSAFAITHSRFALSSAFRFPLRVKP